MGTKYLSFLKISNNKAHFPFFSVFLQMAQDFHSFSYNITQKALI